MASNARARRTSGAEPPVELGREAFRDLERWLGSESSQHLGLAGVERETECRGREVLRVLLQEHIDRRGTADGYAAIRVWSSEDGSLLYSHRRLGTRRLITVFGEVSVTRMGYGLPGRRWIHPLDAELQLPERVYSYEVQRRLVKAAVQGPFDEAIGMLADLNGVRVPKRSAEQIVLDTSVDFEAFYEERSTWECDGGRPLLVAAIDCKGIPMVKSEPAVETVRLRKGQKRQKKRMATVAAVFFQAPEPRTPEQVVQSLFTAGKPALQKRQRQERPRPQSKRLWASLTAGKTDFITGVRSEMLRRDPDRLLPWVIVTDGERALQKRVCALFEDVTLVLDLLHVLEKLWKAAHALHPEGSPEAQSFVRDRTLRILRGDVSQVVKGLRQMVTKRGLQGSKKKALSDVAAYFYRNRNRMRYHLYLENGWPIASGSVEGACKNLVKDRMERSGMRWTEPMAEAMLRLRAVHLSGDFEEYWDFHVRQDQLRLHPDKLWTVVAE